MKNIERPEVILPMLKFLTESSYGTAMLLYDLYKLGMPEDMYKRRAWLYSEYVEPHKWEQWELETLKNIDKNFDKILKKDNEIWIHHILVDCLNMSQINFTSMKNGERFEIDKELERNGMKRA